MKVCSVIFFFCVFHWVFFLDFFLVGEQGFLGCFVHFFAFFLVSTFGIFEIFCLFCWGTVIVFEEL